MNLIVKVLENKSYYTNMLKVIGDKQLNNDILNK